VDSFLPELEHLQKNVSRSLFRKEAFEIWGCFFVSDLKLRSTSSAEKNFADEITIFILVAFCFFDDAALGRGRGRYFEYRHIYFIMYLPVGSVHGAQCAEA